MKKILEPEIKHCENQIARLQQDMKPYQERLNLINRLKEDLPKIQEIYPKATIAQQVPKDFILYLKPKYLTDKSIIEYELEYSYRADTYRSYFKVLNSKVYLDLRGNSIFNFNDNNGKFIIDPEIDQILEKCDNKSKLIKHIFDFVQNDGEYGLTPKVKKLLNFK